MQAQNSHFLAAAPGDHFGEDDGSRPPFMEQLPAVATEP